MARHRKTHTRRTIRILIMAIAIVTFWWGVWGILDKFFNTDNPILSYFIGVFAALLVLYVDDFHLKELE